MVSWTATPVLGGLTTETGRGATTKGGSSPRERLDEEGAEGILTMASMGDGATWFGRASAVRSGDAWSSMRRP
jgi:hypothetical protein